MTTFDERERGFENKFAHDAEMQFRAEARSVMYLALWAAREAGKSSDALVAYSKEIIAHWLSAAGADHVYERVAADLSTAGGPSAPADVRKRHMELLAQAKVELFDQNA